MYGSLLLLSIVVNLLPTQSVSECPLVFIIDGSATVTLNNSRPAKTNLPFWRTFLLKFINERDQIEKLMVISLLVDKRKIVVSV